MNLLLLLLQLSMSPTVGFAPLHTTAKIVVGHEIEEGEVCLVTGENDVEFSLSCWSIDSHTKVRTFFREVILPWQGEWTVAVSINGKTADGKRIAQRTPWLTVKVLANDGH